MDIVLIIGLTACIIPAILKGILHVILDIRNGHRVDFARSKGYVYLLPYEKDVAIEDEKMKSLCNLLQRVFVIALTIVIIIYFVRFIINQ